MKLITTTLAQAPHLKNQVLLLIEEAFGYQKPHHFEFDFLPLMKEDNWNNIYIHLSQSEDLIACGGFRKLSLSYKDETYKMAFIGAIATASAYRGRGIGTLTMNTLLDKLSDQELVVLWSDQTEFYEKFNFHNVGSLSENIGADWCAHNETRALNELTSNEQEQIKEYYECFQQGHSAYPIRSESDWKTIFQMKSVRCTLFPWGYVFANKGMDLSPLIHEAGCKLNNITKLKEKLALYNYWLKHPDFITNRERFAGLCRVQNKRITSEVLSHLFVPGVDSI